MSVIQTLMNSKKHIIEIQILIIEIVLLILVIYHSYRFLYFTIVGG